LAIAEITLVGAQIQPAQEPEPSKIKLAAIALRAPEIIAAIISPNPGMELASVTERSETTTARSGMETISRLSGEITSPGGAQPIGIATGTGIATIGGMAIIAVSSTGPG
jgi:hypothetical protein